MERIQLLKDALLFHGIKIISEEGNTIKVQEDYEIEAEPNRMYKLSQEGYIIAPFADVHALCRFILQE